MRLMMVGVHQGETVFQSHQRFPLLGLIDVYMLKVLYKGVCQIRFTFPQQVLVLQGIVIQHLQHPVCDIPDVAQPVLAEIRVGSGSVCRFFQQGVSH